MRTQRLLTHVGIVAVMMLLMALVNAPATIAKGMVNPQSLAIDDQHGHLFMTDSANTVTEYDARTGGALRSFALGGTPLYPISVAVLPPARRLYVGSRLSDVLSPGRLSVVDTITGHVLRAIPTGPNPERMVLDQRTGRVAVLCSGVPGASAGTVLIVDTQRDVLLETVHIRDYLQVAVLDEGAGRLFIGGQHGVYMLDAGNGRLLRTLPLPAKGASELAVDPQVHRVYMAGGNQVLTLNSRSGTVLGTMTLGHGTYVSALAVDSAAGHLLVTSYNQTSMAGTLSIVNATNGTLLHQAGVGVLPTAVAVLPALDRAIVINNAFTADPGSRIFGTGELRIVQASTGRALVTLEASAVSVVVSQRTSRAYLTDANQLLTIVDVRTGKVLA
ncbi:MAG: cell surface protein [Chloroflexi bacterium]|nr:cell surface protein [Chloroflexota bacterium]